MKLKEGPHIPDWIKGVSAFILAVVTTCVIVTVFLYTNFQTNEAAEKESVHVSEKIGDINKDLIEIKKDVKQILRDMPRK